MKGIGQMTTALTRTITPDRGVPAPAKRSSSSLIDWIIAERIASYVAGEGDAPELTVPLAPLAADAAERVIAYTRLEPTRELPVPEGISRRAWVAANLASMRRMLEPVLERAGQKLGSPRGARSLGVSIVSTMEVGVVVDFLAQRLLGQYELVLLEEASDDPPQPVTTRAEAVAARPARRLIRSWATAAT